MNIQNFFKYSERLASRGLAIHDVLMTYFYIKFNRPQAIVEQVIIKDIHILLYSNFHDLLVAVLRISFYNMGETWEMCDIGELWRARRELINSWCSLMLTLGVFDAHFT